MRLPRRPAQPVRNSDRTRRAAGSAANQRIACGDLVNQRVERRGPHGREHRASRRRRADVAAGERHS